MHPRKELYDKFVTAINEKYLSDPDIIISEKLLYSKLCDGFIMAAHTVLTHVKRFLSGDECKSLATAKEIDVRIANRYRCETKRALKRLIDMCMYVSHVCSATQSSNAGISANERTRLEIAVLDTALRCMKAFGPVQWYARPQIASEYLKSGMKYIFKDIVRIVTMNHCWVEVRKLLDEIDILFTLLDDSFTSQKAIVSNIENKISSSGDVGVKHLPSRWPAGA